ncbi:MAG: hypothetical protein IJF69_04900 [Clostridia bacterium]|nr:hypothetical protein [Clostridia bacterium]
MKSFPRLGFGEKEFDTGYSFELCAPHRVIIKNQYTSYETVYDFPSESKEFEEVFDDNGTPVKNKSVWFWYTEVLPSDTDGDGVYELVARQNTCLLNNADNFGRCISILKYDKKAGGFKVIDAKFEERIYSSDLYHISYEALLYTYTIYDRNGDVIFKDSNWREPEISMVSDDIVELCIQTGTGLSTNWAIFFDVETGEQSETYHHVFGAEGDYVIFGDYDSETDERSIVVQNVFDSSRYYKKYVLEDASSLDADFAAIEPLAYGRWEITYLVGEDYKQEKLVIHLPD